MKVKVLCVSIAPSFYDKEVIQNLSRLNYEGAKLFMKGLDETDESHAFSVTETEIDITKPNETLFLADGADTGETCDTMFTWVKVTRD